MRGEQTCLAALAAVLALVAASHLLTATVTWAFVLNVAGSAGDMLMMRKVMSYPRATLFEDTGDGFRSLWSNRQPGIAIGNVVVAYNSWTRIAPARRRASLDAGRRSLSCDISALNKRSLPNC